MSHCNDFTNLLGTLQYALENVFIVVAFIINSYSTVCKKVVLALSSRKFDLERRYKAGVKVQTLI